MPTRYPHFATISTSVLLMLVTTGCNLAPQQTSASTFAAVQIKAAETTPGSSISQPTVPAHGDYHQDDTTEERPLSGARETPDIQPKAEPSQLLASRPDAGLSNLRTNRQSFIQQGIGSWYGKKFHGRKTSSGELYDMYKLTAAHPTLPIPSYSRVTNLANGKQVIVRINDRGPFHSNRIIDLSYSAALKLGYLGKGSGMLQVEHLRPEDIEQSAQPSETTDAQDPPLRTSVSQYPSLQQANDSDEERNSTQPDSSLTGYYLQLGAFSQEHNAEAMRVQYALTWANKFPPAQVERKGELYRLYAGPFSSRDHAVNAAKQMGTSGTSKPLIIER